MTYVSNSALPMALDALRHDGAQKYDIDHFARQFALVERGFDGFIPEATITPLEKPHAYQDLPSIKVMPHGIASLKLNGGLGTTMGLKAPKSLLPVKQGHTFLSLVLEQYAHGLQGDSLLLMNSFNTHQEITKYLVDNNISGVDCFEQGRVPRLQAATLQPLDIIHWEQHAWSPPGHGQLIDILANGMAQDLLNKGIRYVFVSNIDNLGAVTDAAIPDYMAKHDIPFLMEVCQRQPSDRKGGHVATTTKNGGLVLRDSAMTSDDDMDAFQDIAKHQYFNTNNIWIDLSALDSDRFNHQDLPLITNHKHLEHNGQQADVVQFETALGSAIASFKGAETLLVSRDRFIPVKDIPQWLVLRSDWFSVGSDGSFNESDCNQRPTVAADTVMHGNAGETLQYYLTHPNIERHLQDILQ